MGTTLQRFNPPTARPYVKTAGGFREAIAERYRAVEHKLFSFQREHTKALIRSLFRSKDALDASDTGTGKTYCACVVAFALGLKPFIVCPKPIKIPWLKVAKFIGVEGARATNYEAIRGGTTARGEWVDGEFVWKIDPKEWLIIFDECHRLKGHNTLQSSMGISAVEQGFYVMALSATAADNPLHMKFIAFLTKQIRKPGAFFGWVLRYAVFRTPIKKGSKRKMLRFNAKSAKGHMAMMQLHYTLFPRHGSRMRIQEIPDFPETVIISEAYEMDEAEEIQKVYNEMRVEIAELNRRAGTDRAANILTAKLRARQRAELLKVPTFVEMAQDGVAEGLSVAIFVNFEATLQALSVRLKTMCVVHGGQSDERRDEWVTRFQQDKELIIICNNKAGGVGIGLHGKRMRLGLHSPTHSAIDMRQALGRLPRQTGSKSIQKIVWAAGTDEENAHENCKDKINRINVLNDGELAEILDF